ncbi:hypothetical protein AB0H81_30175, partial [Nonomuraea sp. NPDC050691]
APALDRLHSPVPPARPRPGERGGGGSGWGGCGPGRRGPGEGGGCGRGHAAAAIAAEWLARRDMAAGLRLLRAGRPMPAVPVTVVSTTRRRAPGRRVATALGAELVRTSRRALLRDPAALVAAVRDAGRKRKG